jgi:hypothetical protein
LNRKVTLEPVTTRDPLTTGADGRDGAAADTVVTIRAARRRKTVVETLVMAIPYNVKFTL